jgi:hypothetical protein
MKNYGGVSVSRDLRDFLKAGLCTTLFCAVTALVLYVLITVIMRFFP